MGCQSGGARLPNRELLLGGTGLQACLFGDEPGRHGQCLAARLVHSRINGAAPAFMRQEGKRIGRAPCISANADMHKCHDLIPLGGGCGLVLRDGAMPIGPT